MMSEWEMKKDTTDVMKELKALLGSDYAVEKYDGHCEEYYECIRVSGGVSSELVIDIFDDEYDISTGMELLDSDVKGSVIKIAKRFTETYGEKEVYIKCGIYKTTDDDTEKEAVLSELRELLESNGYDFHCYDLEETVEGD